MPRSYFDTTFYNFIDKGWFPREDVDALRAVLARRRVLGYFSVVNADELLAEWESDREAATRKLRIAQDLVGFDNLLKQPADLLRDDIRAYAAGQPSPPKTLPPGARDIIVDQLRLIVRSGGGVDDLASKIAANVKAMKDGFVKEMADARDQVLSHMDWPARSRAERGELAFERFLEDGSPHWAEALADGAGVGEACRRRGLSGLLMRRPVQLCVDAQMSFVFSQVVPLGGGNQTREADRGDGYDLWHAVLASVADVFITGDGDLEKNLGRVPIGGLRVVTSPRALLDGL